MAQQADGTGAPDAAGPTPAAPATSPKDPAAKAAAAQARGIIAMMIAALLLMLGDAISKYLLQTYPVGQVIGLRQFAAAGLECQQCTGRHRGHRPRQQCALADLLASRPALRRGRAGPALRGGGAQSQRRARARRCFG
jgi:hypothetical protein